MDVATIGVGASSQAHLTKFFKKMRGVTPSAFRQPKPVD